MFTVDVWVTASAAGEAEEERWGARGAGRGSSAAAWGASGARGRGVVPEAAARWRATRGLPVPGAAALPETAPKLLVSLPPPPHRPHTAATESATTAAPSTSAPSGLCGE